MFARVIVVHHELPDLHQGGQPTDPQRQEVAPVCERVEQVARPLDVPDLEVWTEELAKLIDSIVLVALEVYTLSSRGGNEPMYVRFEHQWIQPPKAPSMGGSEEQRPASTRDPSQFRDALLLSDRRYVFQDFAKDNAVKRFVCERKGRPTPRDITYAGVPALAVLKCGQIDVHANSERCLGRKSGRACPVVATGIEQSVDMVGQVGEYPARTFVEGALSHQAAGRTEYRRWTPQRQLSAVCYRPWDARAASS